MAMRAMEPPRPIYEGVGYHAQQCIEKYLKAVLEEADRPVPRIHALASLLDRTKDLLPRLQEHQTAIEATMPFVTTLRYPHDPIEMTELAEDAEQAAAVMREVRAIVRESLGLRDE